MSADICRRFELYNDFIPPTKTIHEWDYLAFGYIDGILYVKMSLQNVSGI